MLIPSLLLDSLLIFETELEGDVGFLCPVLNNGGGGGRIQADCGTSSGFDNTGIELTCAESCCTC